MNWASYAADNMERAFENGARIPSEFEYRHESLRGLASTTPPAEAAPITWPKLTLRKKPVVQVIRRRGARVDGVLGRLAYRPRNFSLGGAVE
jgi:hypothetical protein